MITAASVVQVAVRAVTGTVLVIGANRGESRTDQSWTTLVSPSAAHIHKVFIEPIPPVFRRLQQNVLSVANTTTLQLAVSSQSGTLPMFCIGFDPNQAGVLASNGPFGLPKFPGGLRSSSWSRSAKRDGRGWWTEVCSLSKERLVDTKGDVAADFIHVKDRDHADAAALLSRFVQNVSVRVVTFDELLALRPDSGGVVPIIDRTAVRHVQIDVEGFDDALIRSLPLVKRPDAWGAAISLRLARADGFRPWSIAFEHMLLSRKRLADASDRLRSFGYEVCLEGQNAIAFDTSIRSFKKLPVATRPKQPTL